MTTVPFFLGGEILVHETLLMCEEFFEFLGGVFIQGLPSYFRPFMRVMPPFITGSGAHLVVFLFFRAMLVLGL